MYAVIQTGGKQYRVAPGEKLKVEKLDKAPGDSVEFGEVLLAGEGESVEVGSPLVSDAVVKATVVKHGRGKKLIIYKFKRRKGYHKKQGHRQDYTLVQIDEITAGGKTAKAPEDEEKPAEAEAAEETAETEEVEPVEAEENNNEESSEQEEE